MGKCRFMDYSIRLDEDDSITFEELESSKLAIKPGDGFMAFVNPETQEVTLRKFDISKVEHVDMSEYSLESNNG